MFGGDGAVLRVLSFSLCGLSGLWCGCGRGGCGTYGDPPGFTLSCLKILDNRLLACLSLLALSQVSVLFSTCTFTNQAGIGTKILLQGFVR